MLLWCCHLKKHYFLLNSTNVPLCSLQETCVKCFAVHLLKFEILQTTWKNKTKNIKMLDLLVKNWKLRVWCSLFTFFFMWFARFQILICELQNIWRKLIVLSLLYHLNTHTAHLAALYLPWLFLQASQRGHFIAFLAFLALFWSFYITY